MTKIIVLILFLLIILSEGIIWGAFLHTRVSARIIADVQIQEYRDRETARLKLLRADMDVLNKQLKHMAEVYHLRWNGETWISNVPVRIRKELISPFPLPENICPIIFDMPMDTK